MSKKGQARYEERRKYWICRRCGNEVSKKREKTWNKTQRPDGGFDHVVCYDTKANQPGRTLAERAEQRNAVRLAIQRGDRLA